MQKHTQEAATESDGSSAKGLWLRHISRLGVFYAFTFSALKIVLFSSSKPVLK